ncbi:MAG: tRNA epoxyqueuosine(34) reductase QueG [Gammaproteobacteria bacterium]|nr:tRNA epoxyqueuosine(34) reductase QueG [Gammaproteobacteria bacterium]
MNSNNNYDFNQLALEIKQFGKEIGFNHIGITDTSFTEEPAHLRSWLASEYNGNMGYFERHKDIYEHPQKLMADTARVICCSISYPKSKSSANPIASFAQTQDYSSHICQLLKKYTEKISSITSVLQKFRVFAGNAPILEKALAAKAGLGWYGKNSILLNSDFGSYFFLGEIFTDIPLPIDKPYTDLCGNCCKCQNSCPTKAIIAPYKIDARRCISYLTIEHKGSIPLEIRPLIGNKIFGCDICQQACPWNNCIKYHDSSIFTLSKEFASGDLIEWFLWDELTFKDKTKDSPIGRIGHERWLRNIAVAIGNSIKNHTALTALQSRINYPSLLVREHIEWGLKTISDSINNNGTL